jgi:uridylate kinase
MSPGYRRALVKISGEALAGGRGYGLDKAKALWIAGEIAKAQQEGREIGVVVGGGNILRGIDAASVGVPALVGDQMGMVATVLNALAFKAALESEGITAVAMCAFPVGGFLEVFQREKALEHIGLGRVVVFAGGTGHPCFTTDSAAALRAAEIEADVLVKGTQVRGVFDKDPRIHPDARFFETISPDEVLARRLQVIDAACVDILARKKIPAIVLNLHEVGNIAKALAGEKIGTTIA